MRGVSLAQAGAANLEGDRRGVSPQPRAGRQRQLRFRRPGAAVGDGHSETTMKNEHGVVIKLHGTTDGVDLRLSVDGVWVKLTQ